MNIQPKLKNWINLSFIFIFLILFCILLAWKYTLNKSSEAEIWVEHTSDVIQNVNENVKLLVDSETGQRGYLLSKNEIFLKPYNESIPKINENLTQLKILVQSDPSEIDTTNKFIQLVYQKLSELELTVSLSKAGKFNEALEPVLNGSGRIIMESVRDAADQLIKTEKMLLQQRNATAKSIKSNQQIIIIFSFVTMFSMFGLIYATIYYKFIRPIKSLVHDLSNVANNSATQVIELSKTLSQQSTAITETTSTTEELTSSASITIQQANSVKETSENSRVVTVEEMQRAKISKEESEDLNLSMLNLSKLILQLSSKIDEIGQISKLVGELSNETNILALNASVEAARSGEHGKGFVVIAKEIRKLADQSISSAAKTNLNIEEIQRITNNMVMSAENSSKKAIKSAQNAYDAELAFEKLGKAIEEVALQAKQVALNSSQQRSALVQIDDAMRTLTSGSNEILLSSNLAEKNAKYLIDIVNTLKMMS